MVGVLPRLLRLTNVVVLAFVTSAGCTVPASDEAVRPDFLGELVAADIDGWKIRQARAGGDIAIDPGGPGSSLLVGPATLTLADGSVIDVGLDTLGGNSCEMLGGETAPEPSKCVLSGMFNDRGEVGWFAVGDVPVYGTELFAYVDRFQGRDAIVWLGGVKLVIPIRSDVTLSCSEEGDLRSTPVRVPAETSVALLSEDFEVIQIQCLYSE